MAFVPSKLQETFKIQCPGAETNEELKDVHFEMRPLTRHEVSSIYERRVKNNKGISKFLEEQWMKSCIDWTNVTDGVERLFLVLMKQNKNGSGIQHYSH